MTDGHSKRERMEINDLHLKRVFTEWYYFRLTMSRDLPEAPILL